MTTLVSKTGVEIEIPEIHPVEAGGPRRWLARGWEDLQACAGLSLSLGLVFVAVGYAMTYLAWQESWAVLAAISGFLLVAPFLAMVFYCTSRAREQGRSSTLREGLTCWRGNGRSVFLYALLLTLVLIAWARFSSLATALSAYALGGGMPVTFEQVLGTVQGWVYVWLYLLAGLGLAAAVFLGSVVTPQLMIDRKADPITAVVTSIRVVVKNPRLMLTWAGLIAGLTLLGMATAYLGLVVIFPWLGHASWHAYRDLVKA
jgi:uncharacterized membrane protein